MHGVAKLAWGIRVFTLDSTGLNDAPGSASGYCACSQVGKNLPHLRHRSQVKSADETSLL